MRKLLVLSALGLAVLLAQAKEKKPPEPTLGKIFIYDVNQKKWSRLQSLPQDNIYLHCYDPETGKGSPCVILGVKGSDVFDKPQDSPRMVQMDLGPRPKD